MSVKKLLIFPAGTEIAFELLTALKYSKFVEIYGGTSVEDHSEVLFKKLIYGFPYIDDDNFINYLNDVIRKNKIDIVYPAHDNVLMRLAQQYDSINAQIVTSPFKTVDICRSKLKTYDFFSDKWYIPYVYDRIQADFLQYPVFVKPDVGQGSVGVMKVHTSNELYEAINRNNNLVISEYLPGMEYTVECFTDRNGQLRMVKFRNRERIRAGISVRSRQLPVDDKVMQIAEDINSQLDFNGAWFFQLKEKSNGEYRLMEISPRIPGTSTATRNLGINLPLLTLFDMWGYDVSIIDNDNEILVERAFISRFKTNIKYEHIYVDFDDCIRMKGGEVNKQLLCFLYQSKESGKYIHLLSKHKGDIFRSLAECCISEQLFEDVVVIPKHERKKDYITFNDSIFIDDSFSERNDVKCSLGIPVFDVDMIECLLDWRT